MCRRLSVDVKQRRMIAAANGFLAIGLALWALANRSSLHQPRLHAACGFLMGLSIAMNLGALVKGGRSSGHSV